MSLYARFVYGPVRFDYGPVYLVNDSTTARLFANVCVELMNGNQTLSMIAQIRYVELLILRTEKSSVKSKQ